MKEQQVRKGERASYLLLRGDGELVAGDQVGHLLHAEVQELLTPDHLGEMLLCSLGKEISGRQMKLLRLCLSH